MARKLRVEYPGAIYHVMNRGDRRGAIFGDIVHEAAEFRAERIVLAGMKRLNWDAADLGMHRKGHPDKIELAAELRRQSTVSLAWIANRLFMGTPGYVKCLLYQTKPKK